jgi:hypothetical protein
MTRDRVRIFFSASGLPLRERIRLLKAVIRIRVLIHRHGFDAVACVLEQAGREVGVAVHRQHPDFPRIRRCPVDSACEPLAGWDAFLVHVYEIHTDDTDPGWRRQETVQRLLERGSAR